MSSIMRQRRGLIVAIGYLPTKSRCMEIWAIYRHESGQPALDRSQSLLTLAPVWRSTRSRAQNLFGLWVPSLRFARIFSQPRLPLMRAVPIAIHSPGGEPSGSGE